MNLAETLDAHYAWYSPLTGAYRCTCGEWEGDERHHAQHVAAIVFRWLFDDAQITRAADAMCRTLGGTGCSQYEPGGCPSCTLDVETAFASSWDISNLTIGHGGRFDVA